MRSLPLLMLWVLAASSCAPDLREEFPFDGEVNTGPLVSVTPDDGGVRTLLVDASNQQSQVYVDLDQAKELKADEAFATNAWDLSFKRVTVTSNGGSGNPTGAVKVAVLVNQDWAALTVAPESGYLQDSDVSVFNGPEGGWYIYNITNHGVNPNPALSYVVKSSEAKFYKVRFIGYRDAAGTTGHYTLEYQTITAPAVSP